MGLAEEHAAEGENRTPANAGHAVRGVYVEHVNLLFGLINDRLAAVFEANRSMMESFEQVVKARLGKIKQEGLWGRFNQEVVPLLRAGKLPTAPTEDEILAFGRETDRHLEEGRKAKREHEWTAWDHGAKHFAEACDASTELIAALRQGIGAAEQYRSDRKNKRLAWAGLAAGVVAIVVAVVLAVA